MKEKARVEMSSPESELPGQLKRYAYFFFYIFKTKKIWF